MLQVIMEKTAAPIKQPKWRNLIFDKNGRSYAGRNLWDSMSDAENVMQRALKNVSGPSPQGNGIWVLGLQEGHMLAKDYKWHMQIPVLGE